jgi:hypothetical protein
MKMKTTTVLLFSLATVAMFGCATKSQTTAPVVSMSQADSYFLYAYSVRDAKKLSGKQVPDIVTSVDGNVTVYVFKDHVIKECGTHLTGSVTITDRGTERSILADFPTIEKNPYKIRSFAFDIVEPMGEYRKATGIATVNGLQYPIGEIIRVSGY